MSESKYHECEIINKVENISIEKINGYCPYCGAKLD